MEKRVKRPVRFHFENDQEKIDLFIKIEFKYFLKKLLYSSLYHEETIGSPHEEDAMGELPEEGDGSLPIL